HAQGTTFVGGQKGRAHRDVANVAAGDVETGESPYIEILDRRRGREDTPPDFGAFRFVREGEVYDEANAALESRIERLLHVGGENRQATVGFHTLQQIAHLHVGVAVVAVLDLAALAEQRVRLVEQQDRTGCLGSLEHAAQVLFRLPDVLVHDLAEVDAIE